MNRSPYLSRRAAVLGGVAAGLAAIVAGAIVEGPRLLRRRPRGAYARLAGRLDDPEQAAIVGRAMRADGAATKAAAADAGRRLAGRSLTQVVSEDVRDMGGLVEIEGWVLPRTLAELCLLAARSF
ncbi:MAG TPA: hypothetical protein VG843_08180 [Rhizomicrobium sp.]|jgi:hypothetical protein|nr:hypothetical protein [Rhizomicrobium sp.]